MYIYYYSEPYMENTKTILTKMTMTKMTAKPSPGGGLEGLGEA